MSPATAVAAPAPNDGADVKLKTFETYRAELARLGFGLFELADGTYLAARWDRSRPCADLRAVRQFLAQLGVRG